MRRGIVSIPMLSSLGLNQELSKSVQLCTFVYFCTVLLYFFQKFWCTWYLYFFKILMDLVLFAFWPKCTFFRIFCSCSCCWYLYFVLHLFKSTEFDSSCRKPKFLKKPGTKLKAGLPMGQNNK